MNVQNETGADRTALDICPKGGWFGPYDLRERAPDVLKKHNWPSRPTYRCNRLVEHGHLERRYEDGDVQYRRRATNSTSG